MADRCPLCEGLGQLPDSAVESLLRALADRLGFRLQRKPAPAESPRRDYTAVYDALTEARESLGFGPAIQTHRPAVLDLLARHDTGDWITAIWSQRDSLRSALAERRLTRDQASAYLSLKTIDRSFERCLERVAKSPVRIVRLSDGTLAEERNGQRRVLTPEEARSRGLDPTSEPS